MKFDVDSATMSYLEGLWFDYLGLKTIMTDIMFVYSKNSDYIQSVENCEYFLNEYRESYKKVEMVKSQIVDEYVSEEYKNDAYSCEFLFNEGCVKISEKVCAING